MEKFIEYLKNKYNAPINELSKTSLNNNLVKVEFEMINFEQMKNETKAARLLKIKQLFS